MLNEPIKAIYTNYRGETALRNIYPKAVSYGQTSYHPGLQWLLYGYDMDRKENRNYALKDFVFNMEVIEHLEFLTQELRYLYEVNGAKHPQQYQRLKAAEQFTKLIK